MSPPNKVLIHPTAQRIRRCRRLARVLRITKQMLEAVDLGDWSAVARLEQCRQEDFLACFDRRDEKDAEDALGEGLVALICLNEDLMERLKVELLRRRYPLHDASKPIDSLSASGESTK